jgi:UDP-N-acetyl-D-galactosamine dehydrogenase
MGKFVAEQTVKLLAQLPRPVKDLTVAVLGLTFKENVPDLRNSRVPDIIRELQEYGVQVLVHDPIADPAEAVAEYGIHLQSWSDLQHVDGLIIAVAHRAYVEMSPQELLRPLRNQQEGVVMDVKCVLDRATLPPSVLYWRL